MGVDGDGICGHVDQPGLQSSPDEADREGLRPVGLLELVAQRGQRAVQVCLVFGKPCNEKSWHRGGIGPREVEGR